MRAASGEIVYFQWRANERTGEREENQSLGTAGVPDCRGG
jgi:hypothetical protein